MESIFVGAKMNPTPDNDELARTMDVAAKIADMKSDYAFATTLREHAESLRRDADEHPTSKNAEHS